MNEVLPRPFGDYELQGLLGQGGMGRVYRAHRRGPGLRREVALKLVRPDVGDRSFAMQRALLREAQVGAMVRHPNVVATWELGHEQGVPFIAMELVDGFPLDTLLRVCGPAPGAVALELAVQIADGLAAAHALTEPDGRSMQLIHRDLKPGNIFVTRDGTAKIADFGLARVSTRAHSTMPGTAKGTPAYMAPEQLATGEIDQRADIFALGALLYELITGSSLFGRDSVMETLGAISRPEEVVEREASQGSVEMSAPGLWAVLRACLRHDPALRIGSAAELSEALQALMADAPPAAIGLWLAPALSSEKQPDSTGSDPTAMGTLDLPPLMLPSMPGVQHDETLDGSYAPALARAATRNSRARTWPIVAAAVLSPVLALSAGLWLLPSPSSAIPTAPAELAAVEPAPPDIDITPPDIDITPPDIDITPRPPAPRARTLPAKPTPTVANAALPAPHLLTPHRAARAGTTVRFAVEVHGPAASAVLYTRFDDDTAWRRSVMTPGAGAAFAAAVAIPPDARGLLRYRVDARANGVTTQLGTESAHYRAVLR